MWNTCPGNQASTRSMYRMVDWKFQVCESCSGILKMIKSEYIIYDHEPDDVPVKEQRSVNDFCGLGESRNVCCWRRLRLNHNMYSSWNLDQNYFELFCINCNVEHLPGCPIKQEISNNAVISADGEGLLRGFEDQIAIFFVDSKGQRGDLNVQVEGLFLSSIRCFKNILYEISNYVISPMKDKQIHKNYIVFWIFLGPKSISKCTIEPEYGGRYRVSYTPVEVGIFRVVIKWNGREIESSPFHPKVVNPNKVQIFGGWESILDNSSRLKLVLNEQKTITFDIHSAGPGMLMMWCHE